MVVALWWAPVALQQLKAVPPSLLEFVASRLPSARLEIPKKWAYD